MNSEEKEAYHAGEQVDPKAEAKRRSLLPKVPWFKDERSPMTNMKSSTTVRMFIAAVLIFVGIATWGGVYIFNLAHELQQNIQDGRNSRLDFQNKIQQQSNANSAAVRELACLAANAAPPGTSVFLDSLSKKYMCVYIPQPVPPKK